MERTPLVAKTRRSAFNGQAEDNPDTDEPARWPLDSL